jgi:periplasmic protein CpxP/Spy
MNKEKFLLVSVGFLFLLNLGTIGFLFLGNQRPQPPPELFKIIINELNLDDRQQERLFYLRDQHRSSMDSLDGEFSKVLAIYLNLLKQNEPTLALRDSLENLLASIEKKKAIITLNHFQDVKALGRPDQQKNFEKLIPELTRVLMPPKDPHPPRRNAKR